MLAHRTLRQDRSVFLMKLAQNVRLNLGWPTIPMFYVSFDSSLARFDIVLIPFLSPPDYLELALGFLQYR